MANRTVNELGFARFYRGAQTDAFSFSAFTSYSPSGSIADETVRETIDTEGLETLSSARANMQALTRWMSEVMPQDGGQAIVNDPSIAAVYFRLGFKDEDTSSYWYARIKRGEVVPASAHFDKSFTGKAAYRIEFDRASAFQTYFGKLTLSNSNGSATGFIPITNYSASTGNCAGFTTPAQGDTHGFSEIAIWNTASGKSISRVLIGGQQATAANPIAFSFSATNCAGGGAITALASGAISLSKYVTGFVKPVLRTNADGVNLNTLWPTNDMEFSVDGETWSTFEYGHALAVGKTIRLPVSRMSWLPGVNPTLTLKVRNHGSARMLAAGELYLVPCDVWSDLYASTPAALNQAIISGAYRGDLGASGSGTTAGGDAYLANVDAGGSPTSAIPDCIARRGDAIKFLPGLQYSITALVEYSDGTAPQSTGGKISIAYMPRRRGL